MPEGWYQGFILTTHEEPKTGAKAVFRIEGVENGALVFTVVSAADYTTSTELREAAEDLALRYGTQYAHGLIDLDRYEPGSLHEVTVTSGPPRGSTTDSELETELLNALRRMARVASSPGLGPHLDVNGIAAVLDVDSLRVSAALGEMALSGWVEGHAETLAAGLTQGRCRLTTAGLAEAKRRGSPVRAAAPQHGLQPPQRGDIEGTYDVSVSFAGEDRDYVEATVRAMEARGLRVFYDLDHQAELLGKDLVEELCRVYATQSRRVIFFVSDSCVSKAWPTHERRSALSRAVSEPNRPYILQVKLSDVDVPGVPTTQVWADGRVKQPDEIADLVRRHLEADTAAPTTARAVPQASLKRVDTHLYLKFIALLPSTGVIQLLEERGLPPSWDHQLLNPLKEFLHNWNNAEHEFQDPEIEALRGAFMAAVEGLLAYIARNTFRLDDGDQGIPREWALDQRDRMLEVEKRLGERGDAVVTAHQNLVHAARRRLP